MRRLALLALIVPLTAGCGWADLLLAPTYSGSMGSRPPVHVIQVAPPPIHRGCMAMGPDGGPQPCGKHGPVGLMPLFRPCGVVDTGIAWHLSVRSMSCHTGTTLVYGYFSGGNHDAVRTVLGYTCSANTFRVVCRRGASLAVFIGNR